MRREWSWNVMMLSRESPGHSRKNLFCYSSLLRSILPGNNIFAELS